MTFASCRQRQGTLVTATGRSWLHNKAHHKFSAASAAARSAVCAFSVRVLSSSLSHDARLVRRDQALRGDAGAVSVHGSGDGPSPIRHLGIQRALERRRQ